ncbi:MAG: SDR family NAD(P)-dependent oxidoreductase [Cyclobacteriaceae bacterium]
MTKTALITGGSGNLGKAVVLRFAKEGFKVIATVSPGKDLGYKADGNVEAVAIDLTRESDVEKMVKSFIDRNEKVNCAVLTVGGFAMGDLAKTGASELQKMIDLNFYTAYHVVRPVFSQMMNQPDGGRIVLIGAKPSLGASEGKNVIAYGLSKTLLFKLAEYLNAVGSANNVTVSMVVPSTIDTPQNRKSMPKASFDDWVKPEEIADVIAMVCSAEGKQLREPVLKVYGKV